MYGGGCDCVGLFVRFPLIYSSEAHICSKYDDVFSQHGFSVDHDRFFCFHSIVLVHFGLPLSSYFVHLQGIVEKPNG